MIAIVKFYLFKFKSKRKRFVKLLTIKKTKTKNKHTNKQTLIVMYLKAEPKQSFVSLFILPDPT